MSDPVAELRGLASALGLDTHSVERWVQMLRCRLDGDFEVDEFGFDAGFTNQVFLPLIRPLVKNWLRVAVRGSENLPAEGPALLVANHAGGIPLDALVLQSIVHDHAERHLRLLGAALVFSTPFAAGFARRAGSTMACAEDAERLLTGGHLVGVFPEGFKGLGKPISERYRLKRFGRGGFVATAIRAQVPIIPVSVVGSEESYPVLANFPSIAKVLGLPYFPVTPFFPWLGPFGAIPLPVKWIIDFGTPIRTDQWLTQGDDPMTIFSVTDQVRQRIQYSLRNLLAERSTPFW